MTFFIENKESYLLRIKLTPSAAKNGFKGIYCDEKGLIYLKCYVTVVPEKGKANKELIALLSKELKVAKNFITLISGETDHLKKIQINISPSTEFSHKLNELMKETL